jgi:predicted transcriptional regulator
MKEHVAEIVSAYVGKNQVGLAELPALIASVSQSLASLGQAASVTPPTATPAVPTRRSVAADAITCLDCGYKGKMLKRHLTAAHSVTPDEYRTRWGLAPDYPMVAPNYAAQRSELAKSFGLGRLGGRRKR